MKKQIKKRAAALAVTFLLGAAVTAAPQAAFAEETEAAASEEASGDVKAVPVLIVEGNTIYVDASSDDPWNSIQGTVTFDASNEVEDYGLTEDFSTSVAEQGLMGFPAQNVTDEGEFIFAAAYMSGSGGGVEYTGHIFYITFKDTSTPIDITMYDEYNYELLTATVDGAAEAVTYAPDASVVEENAAKHEADAAAYAAGNSSDSSDSSDTDADADSSTDESAEAEASDTSSRGVVPVIVVLVVAALAVVTVVIARKNKTTESEPDETPDAPTSDETPDTEDQNA